MGIESAWPLFGLRIRTARLELRLPTDDDLAALVAIAKDGIHPADEMPFAVPWSTLPSPAFERGFVQFHWRQRATWTPDEWDLVLVVLHEGRPIGTQSIGAEQFATMRTVDTGSWLIQGAQGRGLGIEMRAAVLAFAFDTLAADVARTQAFFDNAQSNAVSSKLGYVPDGIGRLAPLGVARETQRFRMTRAAWRAVPRPPIVVEGFGPCRALFGLEGSAPRTVILGNSGSGKSTRAREIAAELACPHLDLDTIAFEPGKIAVERPRDAAVRDVEAFCTAHDRWVVEGCYGDLGEVALRYGPELVVLDPGVDVCLRHTDSRDWEPHKYASKAEQDERLPMLRTWVRAYYERVGTCSLAEHRDVFERYTGAKRWLDGAA